MGVQGVWSSWRVKGRALAGAGQSPANCDNRTVKMKKEVAEPTKRR